ncbi:4-hydroxy-tetrahydrodipicolinate synthase [candidate division KSB3 bacterium]|uniref:4-hydroxy-tetrahydrodipicolinate synthase n=1 Tax=candidate division KSB3 bacterium TaxID=2044937 RepID=A0A2G6KK51_9BACT|nr:MAG: 4-hydroxy-tetrahydrodipicolinate synthase [candidate division KSB3 bacterium]
MKTPEGILPALVTPMDKEGTLLPESFRTIIDYTLEGGVHGLFVLGSTGEAYAVNLEEKRRVMECAIEHNNGRVPMYIGVGGVTTRDTVQLAQTAEAAGADAISVLTPYFITPSYDELKEHFLTTASSVKIPVLLYNNVGRTNVDIPPRMIEELSSVDNLVGIKDSSGDMTKMAEYIRLTRGQEFSVFCGRDTLILANLMYGGKGAVAATAGFAPELAVGIYNAFMEGDYDTARNRQLKLTPLRLAFSLASFPALMKEALNLIGFDAGVTLAPIGEMTESNRHILIELLKDAGLYQKYA